MQGILKALTDGDSGYRKQRLYQQFIPRKDHGDEMILEIQSYFAKYYATADSVATLVNKHIVSTRTLQRRFLQVTRLTTVQYLQKIRLHNACRFIELTQDSDSQISYPVGYQRFQKVVCKGVRPDLI